MPWHTRNIPSFTCVRSFCNAPATVWLHNPHNEQVAAYCTKHGEEAAARQNREDGLS